jgi:hypothetical protein
MRKFLDWFAARVKTPGKHQRASKRSRSRTRRVAIERLEDRLMLDCAAHSTSPVLQVEHCAVIELVDDAAVTHVATNPGDWDDPLTWNNLDVPDPGANVKINAGVAVTIDHVIAESLRTLRVDGTLRFDAHQNTGLAVDTMVVMPGATLEIGTEAEPVDSSHTATITFTDSGPINTAWDPFLFSRGLISHGQVRIYGSAVTPFVAATGTLAAGAATIQLAEAPAGWKVGDRVLLAGTDPFNHNDDETFTIATISGTSITLDHALAYNHATPHAGLPTYLANLSRNVQFRSAGAELARRGHVMFMHSDDVEIAGAGFYDLGRTNKAVPANDPVVVNDVLQSGTGTNPRGRYALHVHRTGITNPADPVVVRDSVVVGNRGWGFVNHSSNVAFEDNVAFDVTGAAFVTEAGDEIGSFQHNLAVRSTGSGQGTESRLAIQDFAHEGYGFWFQGGGPAVTNNIAAGHAALGFKYYLSGLVQPGLGTTQFLVSNLTDPTWAAGSHTVRVPDVPLRLFQGNTTFASASGGGTQYHLLHSPHELRSTIENFTAWNLVNWGVGFDLTYTSKMNVKNAVLLGNPGTLSGTGIAMINATERITYDNVRAEGWWLGIALPMQGTNVVQGGTYKNVTNFTIPTHVAANRTTTFSGPLTLDSISPPAGQPPGYHLTLNVYLDPGQNQLPVIFTPDAVRMDTGPYAGKQIYFKEQAASFVPFKSGQAPAYVPSVLIGKTNQQIRNSYGLMLAGALAPSSVTTDAKINGLIGTRATYQPELRLYSAQFTSQLQNYQLIYFDANGVKVTDPTLVTLKAGWNLITRTIGGAKRSFFVYGVAPPPPPSASAGTFEFEHTTLAVREAGGTFTVKVKRVGGSTGAVSITYATRAETAGQNSDFVFKTGKLDFLAGETEKLLTFQIIDDHVKESVETFRLVLSNPTGGAKMTEAKRRVQVSINDND